VWRKAIQRAESCCDYKFVLQSMQVVLQMFERCRDTHDQVNLDDLTEQQLKDYVLDHLAEKIAKRPEIILLAASQLPGWTVIPPNDEGDERPESVVAKKSEPRR
jgi:hypothetical protein